MISKNTTRQILETARIEDVVSDFLTLRRSGANLSALCPFHHEKTPSFTVSPVRNTFKCFGCGKGGNTAKFLMEHEGYSFPEALRWLAKKYNIEIQEVQPSPEQLAAQQEEESLFILNDFALKFFQSLLPGAGLGYLKSRGFTEATIQKFGLGFAPDSWDALTKAATSAGFKLEYLQKLGLTTQSGKDFFRNRVIFPIHNLSGKPIAFAGRILQPDANAPKYLNSPESDIYHKSKTLYGIHFARKDIRQQDECILVEGYTDLISLHQAGIENVVASAGTALTVEQLMLIRRFSPNLKILYDGDPAGISAAMRGLDLALEQDMNVKIVPLPYPDDPDSFLRKVGIAAFTEFITTQAKDFITFKANLLLTDANNDPIKKAAAVHDMVNSIARILEPIKRSFFIKDCATLVGLNELALIQETDKAMQALVKKQQQLVTVERPVQVTPLPIPKGTSSQRYEREITRLLLEHGAEISDPIENITVAEHLLASIEDALEHFEDPLCQRICRESIQLVLAQQPITPQYFIAHEDLAISELAAELTAASMKQNDNGFSPGWQERDFSLSGNNESRKVITHAVLRLKFEVIQRWSGENRRRLEEAQRKGDTASTVKFLKAQSKLNEARNELAKQLGMVIS